MRPLGTGFALQFRCYLTVEQSPSIPRLGPSTAGAQITTTPISMHRILLITALLALLFTNCGGSPEVKATGQDTDRQIRDLISALTPASPTANSAVQSDWIDRYREVMDRLSEAGPEVGQAALDKFHESDDAILDVRRGLLRVAAHNLPAETVGLLETLFEEFGEHLGIRMAALELLVQTSPTDAIRLLEPILAARRPGKTYPDPERLVTCYAEAALASELGEQAALTLAGYASNLFFDQTGRKVAVQKLVDYPSPHSRETLRIVLVESTGNAYLRRIAANTLVKMAKTDAATKDALCGILNDVMNKEADVNFQLYLVNMITEHCNR
jgi:hypothetical protein